MAFVSERIKEEDKEYFDSIGFTTLVGEEPVRPFWWVIDREREIIMTCRGGVFAEPTEGYQIYIKKQFVNIELVEEISGSYSKKNISNHYKISRLIVPKQLIDDGLTLEKIKKLINKMFMIAGHFGAERDVTIETIITIENEPIVV